MKEIWKPVVGLENVYQVSSLGRVKRLKGFSRKGTFIEEKILKQNVNHKGYLTVHICEKERRRIRPVHRLVAEAFVENPLKKPQVNHKNGNKLDNRCENLEWVYNHENVLHACRHGLITDNYRPKRIKATMGDHTITFDSIDSFAKYLKVKPPSFSQYKKDHGNKGEYRGCKYEVLP